MEEFHISEQDVEKFVDSYPFRRLPAHPCIFAGARRDPIADFTAGQMLDRPPSAYYGFTVSNLGNLDLFLCFKINVTLKMALRPTSARISNRMCYVIPLFIFF